MEEGKNKSLTPQEEQEIKSATSREEAEKIARRIKIQLEERLNKSKYEKANEPMTYQALLYYACVIITNDVSREINDIINNAFPSEQNTANTSSPTMPDSY